MTGKLCPTLRGVGCPCPLASVDRSLCTRPILPACQRLPRFKWTLLSTPPYCS